MPNLLRHTLHAAAIAACLSLPRILIAQGTTIPVIGTDYAFQLPDTLKAGPVVFTLRNQGLVHHMITVYLLKEGQTMADFVRAAPQERAATYDEIIGVVTANAGRAGSGRLGVDLVTGRTYLLVCNDRDAADKPFHVQLGMVKSVYVR